MWGSVTEVWSHWRVMPESVKWFYQKAGFSKQDADASSSDLRKSMTCLPGKVVQIPSLVSSKENCSLQDHLQQLAEFFLYLWKELKLSVLAGKDYRGSLIMSSSCPGWILLQSESSAICLVVSRGPACLGRSNHQNWTCLLVLRSVTCLSYEPLKLSMYEHLPWKTCFLLALALGRQ